MNRDLDPYAAERLSKFEVAERQLNQAIALFFAGGDSVSVHTLSEAAAQILYDLREQFNGRSLFRDHERIREEYRAEWNASLVKSRNFFKHADRDPTTSHEFREDFNHFSLLDATNLYLSAKNSWTPETILFFAWFATTYPLAVNPDVLLSSLVAKFSRESCRLSPGELRRTFARGLTELRAGTRPIRGISLATGLPNDG